MLNGDGDEIARGRVARIAHDGSVRALNDGVAAIERCCGRQAASTCAQVCNVARPRFDAMKESASRSSSSVGDDVGFLLEPAPNDHSALLVEFLHDGSLLRK